jgi:hypothetical protein
MRAVELEAVPEMVVGTAGLSMQERRGEHAEEQQHSGYGAYIQSNLAPVNVSLPWHRSHALPNCPWWASSLLWQLTHVLEMVSASAACSLWHALHNRLWCAPSNANSVCAVWSKLQRPQPLGLWHWPQSVSRLPPCLSSCA